MKLKNQAPFYKFEEAPYRDLYIYLISGRVTERDEEDFGEAFMGNWVEDETSFLFFSRPSPESVSDFLEKRPDLELIEHHHFTYEQWQGGGLEPITIEDILITPPWKKNNRSEGKIRILLDPGVVFGSGLHLTPNVHRNNDKTVLKQALKYARRFEG